MSQQDTESTYDNNLPLPTSSLTSSYLDMPCQKCGNGNGKQLNQSLLRVWLLAAVLIPTAVLSHFLVYRSQPSSKFDGDIITSSFDTPIKIAIIGAGSGGTSAAYYLQKYSNSSYEITIFERSEWIGGRSMSVDIHGVEVELGASIFVDANKILMNAVEEFDLEVESFGGDDDTGFGIWDGKKFAYILKDFGFYSKLKFLYHFGLSSIRKVEKKRSQIVNTFLNDYYKTGFPYECLCNKNSLTEVTSITGSQLLEDLEVSLEYQQFIESLTRVNYAQNIDQIHALGTMVTMSTDGAKSVVGGNRQIFEKWVESSKATLHLSTTVDIIDKLDYGFSSGYNITYHSSLHPDVLKTLEFDRVIIAAPLNQSQILINVDLPPQLVDNVPEYVTLYVTIVSSPNSLKTGKYFNTTLDVPQSILTTKSCSDFTSLNQINHDPETGEYIYKLFSLKPLEETILNEIFVTYSMRIDKVWLSYPYLKPLVDLNEAHFSYSVPFEIHDELWYCNLMESFISTMETSALSGANVAALIAARDGARPETLVVP
ncbi:hypothetical protein CANARDRAFT_6306 [[Candida] arabinofermentans NRRL YB-2248]|uniref:Prenylcysteine lyase domain-containing protein n=1 Tax=[Candida] arabinofermentans NRRL YB-2248 TaxID=983967 RepID=A0A1E4T4R5_9ASCO|nr:hypothetical protein CANARDRAFT_6306 [[Candida] arabinofermentans NRRL YB-2248]